MNKVKNALIGVLSTSMVVSMAFSPVAFAQTTADMQAQIAALLAQVQALTAQLNAGAGASVTFTRNLTVGSTGADVMSLQKFLNAHGCPVAVSGVGSVGMETSYFGNLTKAAVACWQAAHNITPAVGYFGPITRGAINAVVVVTPNPNPIPPTPTPVLSGGAGSVNDYSLVSSLSNETVGEDANDVKVAGLEVEADNGSDLQFTAMRLVFNEGTANSDFDQYADEVSVWLGTNEVARVNADEFNSDNDWSKTVSLDSDAIIRAGKIGTFYVAVSGAKNIDSADLSETWTVDFTSARFKDAQGATISEDPTVAVTTFSFESFASAADTEFKITDGLASVNDAHVINIATSSDDTNDVSILSYNVEIKGDSDVNLDAVPVMVSTSAASIYAFISGLTLWMDGEEVGSVNLSTDCLETTDTCAFATSSRTYLFDNLDLNLNAGSDYDFLVKADIKSTSDAGVADGDTIYAAFGETETDLASFKAKDESNTNLSDSEKTGSVASDASEVRDIGIMVSLVSVAGSKTFSRDATVTSTNDQGTFTITFDVTAFDGDVWIDKTAPTTTAVGNSKVSFAGTETILASSIVKVSGATEETDGFKVTDGTTARFTITGIIEPTVDGLYDMSLDNLRYALSDIDGNISYTFNLTNFKTGQVFLDFGAA